VNFTSKNKMRFTFVSFVLIGLLMTSCNSNPLVGTWKFSAIKLDKAFENYPPAEKEMMIRVYSEAFQGHLPLQARHPRVDLVDLVDLESSSSMPGINWKIFRLRPQKMLNH
jgi:hypothetical protein